jgi:hypothetical protein
MSRPTQITSPGARVFLSPVLFPPPPRRASCFDPFIHTHTVQFLARCAHGGGLFGDRDRPTHG